MKKMYNILLEMKSRFSTEDWLMCVEQAYAKDKITEEERDTFVDMIDEK